jgi:hypothetical protein
MTNLAPEEKKTEYITKKKTKRKAGPASGLGKNTASGSGKKEGKLLIKMVGEDGKLLDQPIFVKEFSKGGRAGYKDGSKGCKMATKGKGRAYGKNS